MPRESRAQRKAREARELRAKRALAAKRRAAREARARRELLQARRELREARAALSRERNEHARADAARTVLEQTKTLPRTWQKPRAIPIVPNTPAWPALKPKALLRAVRLEVGYIVAETGITDFQLSRGVLVDRTRYGVVSLGVGLRITPPKLTISRTVASDVSAGGDGRAILLVDAFNRVAEVSPWYERIGPAAIPRGVAFYVTFRLSNVVYKRDVFYGSRVDSTPLANGRFLADWTSWRYGNALNVARGWREYLVSMQKIVNSEARFISMRLWIEVPLQSRLALLRSEKSDEQWNKDMRREGVVHNTPQERRKRRKNAREH